jgi:AcrR family transcriptional regulator
MSQLARAVGISRQALYLHFPDRAALLVALVEHVDEREELATGVAAVMSAPDGAAKVRAWVHMQATRNPRIAPFARALAQVRHSDPAVSLAWRNRMQNRMRGATAIVSQLADEDRLHPSWTTEEAAVLLWELASFQVWDDLVDDAGLAPDRYVEIVVAAALAALAGPVAGSP